MDAAQLEALCIVMQRYHVTTLQTGDTVINMAVFSPHLDLPREANTEPVTFENTK